VVRAARLGSVSVVIAAYNAGRFVDEALRSVASQVLLPDRVIVVDDASRDDTVSRVRRWSGELPLQLHALDRNVGPGAARARALRRVDTELVCFLDADDVWLPDHLDHLVRLWGRRGGAISPRALIWPESGATADYHRSLGLTVPRRRQLARLLAINYLFYGLLFPKADYDRAGGMGPLRFSEDWDLWVRMAAAGTRFALAERPTVLYRRHDDNATATPAAVDDQRVGLIEHFHDQHPEWLPPRRWGLARRHGDAVAHARRGLLRLQAADLGGLDDLAHLRDGGWASTTQFGRQVAYFAYRAAKRRSSPQLRQGIGSHPAA
jgi:glycosyltransferase involved in cell wall biosynthesis